MIPFSILDLAPVPEGSAPADTFRESVALARHAEALGYHRYWLAEHHNMPGIACSATVVLIGHIAAATSRIRVGSGGIMLPNHAPLVVAEQFGTLATLFPDRIDLGLGRAPGTDMPTARALRRGMGGADNFPSDVQEVMGYLGEPQPGALVRAIPGEGTNVPVWILGSSLFGAQLAAHLGLPYAFASHFAPAALDHALAVYRETFRPSMYLDQPYFMLALNVHAADTDEEAVRIRTSQQLAFAAIRTGRPGRLPAPVERIEDHLDPMTLAAVSEALKVSVTGSPESVRKGLEALLSRYRPDEVIFAGHIHDPAARMRSYEIAAEVMRGLSLS
ncbi:MAG TPA: LLM class flavin-dependent oxidoreductase [Paracoccaceae bacterium]|nr:LLM class flavin-dependent oxidoreductase [Paracoccaceae bacterium]